MNTTRRTTVETNRCNGRTDPSVSRCEANVARYQRIIHMEISCPVNLRPTHLLQVYICVYVSVFLVYNDGPKPISSNTSLQVRTCVWYRKFPGRGGAVSRERRCTHVDTLHACNIFPFEEVALSRQISKTLRFPLRILRAFLAEKGSRVFPMAAV